MTIQHTDAARQVVIQPTGTAQPAVIQPTGPARPAVIQPTGPARQVVDATLDEGAAGGRPPALDDNGDLDGALAGPGTPYEPHPRPLFLASAAGR